VSFFPTAIFATLIIPASLYFVNKRIRRLFLSSFSSRLGRLFLDAPNEDYNLQGDGFRFLSARDSKKEDATAASSLFLFLALLSWGLVSAFRADAISIQSDSAERASCNRLLNFVFLACTIHPAAEGDLGDIEFVLEEIIDDLDHSFDSHGFLVDHYPAIRIGSGEFRLEGRSFHLVRRRSVSDALLVIDSKDGRKQRIIFPKNQGMIEVLQKIPASLLDFVAGENHIDSRINRIFDFDGKDAGMAMQILRLSFEAIETMSILEF